jgi:hypothetical protein
LIGVPQAQNQPCWSTGHAPSFIEPYTQRFRTRAAIAEGSSSIANVTVHSNPCGRDEYTKSTRERVSGNPSFVRAFGVVTAQDDGRFDALATVAGDSFDVEDRERHTVQL